MMDDGSAEIRHLRIGRDVAAIILLIVFPVLQVFATRAAPVAIAGALVCVLVMHVLTKGAVYEPLRKRGLHRRPVNIALLLALCWWTVSLFWSPELRFALRDMGGIVLLCAGVIFLPAQLARTTIAPISTILLIGVSTCALILILEVQFFTRLHTIFSSSARSWDLNRMALLLVAILPSVGLVISQGGRHAIFAVPIAIMCATAVFLSESQSAQLALVVGLLAVPAAMVLPMAGRMAAVGFAALLIFMPIVTANLDAANENGSLSILPAAHGEHRIALWAGYNDVIEERPLFGWGAGSARHMGTTGRAAEIAYERGYPKWTTNPHNAPLEIWTEQGLVGALLAAFLIWTIGVAIDRQAPGERVALTFIFGAATTFSFVSSSLYQGWWLSTLAIGIVCCIAVARSARHRESSSPSQGFGSHAGS